MNKIRRSAIRMMRGVKPNPKKDPTFRRVRAVYPHVSDYKTEIDLIPRPTPMNPKATKKIRVFCGRRSDGARVVQG